MCGIAGFLLRQGTAQGADVRLMCDQIRHRGPDDEGIYTEGGCGIGMRRLSIIDLSTGHQPIPNEDETVWIVFNGEIYDYQRLRDDLIAKGHRFRTQSDTETIVHLYEQEGIDGIQKLRGMFAFCIWDSRKRQVLIARDRFGKKPLYYSVGPQGLWFGSELKCLQAAGVPLEVDREALKLYFQFSYIPDPYSAYKDIRKLPAAGWMTYDAQGNFRQGRYWQLPPFQATSPVGLREGDAQQMVRDAFDEAVRIRMVADVPLGAFLSGGIDSSLIVASMARQSKEPVKTFSIGWEESAFNETQFARIVAQQYKTDHQEIIVRPDAISLVHAMVQSFDEPFADSAAMPTYILCREAVKYVKVALTGDGGDELFGGYESFKAVQRMQKLDAVPQFARGLMSQVASALPYSSYGKNYLRMISRPSALSRYFEFNYAPYFLRERLLQPDWMLPADAAYLQTMLPECFHGDSPDTLSQVMYWEATANLTGGMLVKVDRMSMANSLEVRCPLMDHVLAELVVRFGHNWRIRDGYGKRMLIDSMRDRLPMHLFTRPKTGFGVPLELWFRSTLRNFLWDHLNSERFLNRDIVSPAFLKELLSEHDAGRRDNSQWLWALLMLELWFENLERIQSTSSTGESGHAMALSS